MVDYLLIVICCVVVVLFMTVEEKCFPSHTFDGTFYFLDQALQITVSWRYRYVFSSIIESDFDPSLS